jgi:Cupin domain
MPVFRATSQSDGGPKWPDWCNFSSAGIFMVPVNGHFDRHYHDCDEYWLVFQGRARVLSEGVEYDVGRGDIVCTRAGEEHDVLGVWEDLAAFFLEDGLLPGGKPGHLHRSVQLVNGHVVPALADTGATADVDHVT